MSGGWDAGSIYGPGGFPDKPLQGWEAGGATWSGSEAFPTLEPPMDALTRRQHAREIFEAGLAAADAEAAVARSVALEGGSLILGGRSYPLGEISRVRVVGMGKASAAMAVSLERRLGSRIDSGLIIVKDGHTRSLERIRIVEAGHPVPDQRGVEGVQALLRQIRGLEARDLVVCLISGGGSALTPAPVAGITLEQKQEVTAHLLSSGATIHEMNTIRKHLSEIKGGNLTRHAHPARVISLILSDVIGDDLDTIASGPTVGDRSTFGDCLAILHRRGLSGRIPPPVLSHLEAGARKQIPETLKADDPIFAGTQNLIVGNNRLALEAAGDKGKKLGYDVVFPDALEEGEAQKLAADHLELARRVRAERPTGSRPVCILTGGEATVTLRGPGKGGRNQEFALAASIGMEGFRGMTLLSGGTDGTDGPTDAAGAICDGETTKRGRGAGLDPMAYLSANDSYHFFQPLGDLLMTGPTSTNVMDLRVILVV